MPVRPRLAALAALSALGALAGCLPMVVIDHKQEVWTQVPVGAEDELTAVQFLDLNTGYVVGDHGTILKTTDGGKSWVRLVPTAVAGKKLIGISFLDAAQGFAISETSLYKTMDGGATWEEAYDFAKEVQDQPRAVKFVTGSAGFVTGNKAIYQTLDGKAWTKANVKWGSAVENNGSTVYIAGFDVFTSNLTDVYVGVPGAKAPCEGQGECGAAIHFLDAQDGWMFGANGTPGDGLIRASLQRTRDGGRTWTGGDPGKTFFPLLSYAGNKMGIYPPRLRFATPDHGWVLIDGDVVSTADGGQTWKRQAQFMSTGEFKKEALKTKLSGFYDVSAPDATHAWLVGAGGRVYKWEGQYYPPYVDRKAPLAALWDPKLRD